MTKENFFVYILQSMKDFSFYIGQTHDLDKRISQHNDGLGTYTSKKMPWRLVYFEMLSSREESILRESALKKWKNKERYKSLIKRRLQDESYPVS